jgi:hypothetical protein
MIPTNPPTRRISGRLTRGRFTRGRLTRILGLLWLVDGLLQLQPYNFSPQFLAWTLGDNTMGPPGPIKDLIEQIVLFTFPHHVAWNAVFAAIQLVIGVGLLCRGTTKAALAASVAWSLGVWFVGEGFGGLIFPQASMLTGAPGPALLMALAALLLWPRSDRHGPAVADGGLLGSAGAQVAWFAIWVGTAFLELERSNNGPDAIAAQIRALAGGPADLPGQAAFQTMDHVVAHALTGTGTVVALLLAVVQVWVGMAILRPATRKAGLVAGIAVSAVYWVVGQNLGGIFSGQSSDPGAGIVLVLIALALWPRSPAGHPGPGSRPGEARSYDRGVGLVQVEPEKLTELVSQLRGGVRADMASQDGA